LEVGEVEDVRLVRVLDITVYKNREVSIGDFCNGSDLTDGASWLGDEFLYEYFGHGGSFGKNQMARERTGCAMGRIAAPKAVVAELAAANKVS
jgi:hypothetical protein